MIRRVGGLLVAAALCLSTPAHALPTPVSPTDAAVAAQWANPFARPDEPTDIGVELVEADASRVVLSVFNNSGETVSDLTVTPRRADAAATVGDARRILALDRDAYPYFGTARHLGGELAPGERREVSIPVEPLALNPGGTYPLMFALTGAVGQQGVRQLGTERMLFTTTAGQRQEAQVPDVSLIVPVSAPVDIVPGETGRAAEDPPLILESEQLAAQLAPGGRLNDLINTYATATTTGPNAAELSQGTCLAIDPALVDTVARMAEGYTVSPERPSMTKKAQRLRDSWGSAGESDPGEPGRGAADAQEWLARLSTTAGAGCTVALPWANADLNAVAATEDEWLFREAVQRGPATLQAELGAAPSGNVVIPAAGYVTEQTATALGWADQTGSTVLEDGMQATWEAAVARRAPQQAGAEHSSLESPVLPEEPGAPVPQTPVQVLVADNTVWGVPQVDNIARLAPGINAVTYPGALGALLAATGPQPQTAGYSNPDSRFDARFDSPLARALTAGSAVRLAVAEQTLPADWAQSPEPVLILPASLIDAPTAAALLTATAGVLAEDAATPLPLDQAVTPAREQAETLDAQPLSPPTLGVTRFGSPYADPAVFSDTEVLRASQQARYTDDLTRMMVNDRGINLTRYGFTLPLRRDVLMSLSATSRSSLGHHEAAVAATDRRLDGNRRTLQDLRGSVALIPPGNVYTRASESSPLLIVAENGLPLPVDTELVHDGPPGARVDVPGRVHIPAHGSITVQMTADLPADQDQTQLTLWLATRDGSPISTAVDITVQTRTGIVGTYGIALLLVVGLSLALLFRLGRQRRGNRQRP
ncbi:hypothetical protein [Corynebacterium lemuris]|uniref:hypothetical protein n=1 Tax=Corynebacterium lemuris TaxID=1859292 RepID=UPI002714AD41|nr:hypothetical protein [Corynebacterium lemuris]